MSLTYHQILVLSLLLILLTWLFINCNILSQMILLKTFTPLPLSLAQKECIDAILNAKVIFTRDGEVQRISIRELDNQIDSNYT